MFRLLALISLLALSVSTNAQDNKTPPKAADEFQLLLEKSKALTKQGEDDEANKILNRIIEKANSTKEQQLIRGDAYFFRVRLRKTVAVAEFSQAKECWLACGLTKAQAQERYDSRKKEWDDLVAYRKLYAAGETPEQLAEKKRLADEAEAKQQAESERKRQEAEAERLRLAQEERAEKARIERAEKERAAEQAKLDAEKARQERLLAEEKNKATKLRQDREELQLRQESYRREQESRAAQEKAKREEEEAATLAKAAAFNATLFLVGLAVLIITFYVFVLLLAVWVLKDCRNRSVDNRIFWMLLIIPFNLIAFLIYMASRPNGRLVPCEHCGNKRLPYATMCPHCHEKIVRKDVSPDRFSHL